MQEECLFDSRNCCTTTALALETVPIGTSVVETLSDAVQPDMGSLVTLPILGTFLPGHFLLSLHIVSQPRTPATHQDRSETACRSESRNCTIASGALGTRTSLSAGDTMWNTAVLYLTTMPCCPTRRLSLCCATLSRQPCRSSCNSRSCNDACTPLRSTSPT